MNPKAIYWLDVETTGLDPNDDQIIEISVARAKFDRPFDIVLIANYVIGFTDWTDVSEYVIDMHHKSGLMIECLKSKLTLEEVETKIINALIAEDWMVQDEFDPLVTRKAKSSNELPVLGGSSIDFDRGFLRSDMPKLAKFFSHRLYDISPLKLMCRSIGMPEQPKKEAHRSKDDIIESVLHVQECFWWLATHNVSDMLRNAGSEKVTPKL